MWIVSGEAIPKVDGPSQHFSEMARVRNRTLLNAVSYRRAVSLCVVLAEGLHLSFGLVFGCAG